MSNNPTKVLVLGIDAANPLLLLQWAKDGTLPFIHSLITRGQVGKIRGVEGFHVGSTWPSFYTGLSPARHGFHYLIQLRPGTYDFYRPADNGIVGEVPFWSHLSQAGRRVAVLDVPLSCIDSSLNGIQVVEWGSHDSVYGFKTWPTPLAETIRSRFGVHPLGLSCDAHRQTPGDYQAFINQLVQGIRAKTELTRHFLREGNWDFFMQVFTESHCVGHQCWHLHDVNHPAHEPSIFAVVGDPLRHVYVAIDRAVSEVVEEAENALVVLLAAHGMSYWYGAQFLLREILFRLGVTQPLPAPPHPNGIFSTALNGPRWIWRRLPTPIRKGMVPLLEQLRSRDRGELPTIGVDTAASRCFPVNNGLAIGGIRLNLIGREPQGVLKPGQEAKAFSDELTENLLNIKDERTSRPLIRRILQTADLYAGNYLDHLPDLLVEWSDEVPTGSTLVGGGAGASIRAVSPEIGVVEGANDYNRTGEHRLAGLFIATGPMVSPGEFTKEISLLDLAPTFARYLSVELPDCEGRPLDELLKCGPTRGSIA